MEVGQPPCAAHALVTAGVAGWRALVGCVRCQVVSWPTGGWSLGVTGACGAGVKWWAFFWGALVMSWSPVDGDGGRVWGVE